VSRYGTIVAGGTRVTALAAATGATAWDTLLPHAEHEFVLPLHAVVEPSGGLYVNREAAKQPIYGSTRLARLDAATGAVLGHHTLTTLDTAFGLPSGEATVSVHRLDSQMVTRFGRADAVGRQGTVTATGTLRPAQWLSGETAVGLALDAVSRNDVTGTITATVKATVTYAGDPMPAPLRLQAAAVAGHVAAWSCMDPACGSAAGSGPTDVQLSPLPGASVDLVMTLVLDRADLTMQVVAAAAAPFAVGGVVTADDVAVLDVADRTFANGFE
jgi:hypothetical protein